MLSDSCTITTDAADFLIRLRSDLEYVHSQLLNREPTPFSDVVRSIISEETRPGTIATSISPSVGAVLIATTHHLTGPLALPAPQAPPASSDAP